MATLKHINSKNADYGAAEQYLLFEHDEFTMKPVLDETGRLIPREDYRLSHAELRRGGFCRCVYAGQSPLSEKPAAGRCEKPPLHHQL